ncbi:MAG: hypothetical protein E4H30_06250 [Methanomassiliicoccus sp.]|nr:MAG: hypothetical protein E4H30_06250 [Methanomassiliicoccus sp.]
MTKVRMAKRSDLKWMHGKENLLGGPSFSLPVLEMFSMTPDFTVHVAGDSAMVLYHEGKGGKSRLLMLLGTELTELLQTGEEAARRAGTVKITLEVDPRSETIPQLESSGYQMKGDLANYFGKDRPAHYMEKILL